MTFSELAIYLDQLEATSSRNELVRILAEAYKACSVDEIEPITYLIQGRLAPFFEPVEIGLAEKLLLSAMAMAYGTPKDEVLPWLDQGFTVILDVDPQGFRAVRKVLPAMGVFLMPPSVEVLDARLKGRATEDAAALARRLANAHAELACANEYDHRIVNYDVARTLNEIEQLVGLSPAPEAGSGRRPDHS